MRTVRAPPRFEARGAGEAVRHLNIRCICKPEIEGVAEGGGIALRAYTHGRIRPDEAALHENLEVQPLGSTEAALAAPGLEDQG